MISCGFGVWCHITGHPFPSIFSKSTLTVEYQGQAPACQGTGGLQAARKGGPLMVSFPLWTRL